MTSPIKRTVGASLIMVIGVSGVIGLMVLMNQYVAPPKKEKTGPAVSVSVQKAPPPPKRRKARPTPKRRQSKKMARRTPPPNLSSQLSSVSLGQTSSLLGSGVGQGDDLIRQAKNSDLVMTSETVDEPPRATRRVGPAYPREARKNGVTGFVTFSLVIGADGEVDSSKIIASEPQGTFEMAARDAIERWQFKPGFYQGKPQRVVVEQTIRFTLSRGS